LIDTENAIKYLKTALDKGGLEIKKVAIKDVDFKNIRETDEFKKLLQQYE
jgi:hypothetical protein